MKMGLAIARRREELGLTQEELANAVGVTKGSISRWESGDISNMRRDRIQKLAESLKVSPIALLADETEGLKENATDNDAGRKEVFISYSHGASMFADELAKVLSQLSDDDLKQVYNYALFLVDQSSQER